MIGTKEKLIRSEVGSRTIRYETIRPDKVTTASATKQKNDIHLKRTSLKDTTVYPSKKDIFAPQDELEEQI